MGDGLGLGEGEGDGVEVGVGAEVGEMVAEGVETRVGVGIVEVGRLKTPTARPGMIWINLAVIPPAPGTPTTAILKPTVRLAEEVADLDLMIVSGVRNTVYLDSVLIW